MVLSTLHQYGEVQPSYTFMAFNPDLVKETEKFETYSASYMGNSTFGCVKRLCTARNTLQLTKFVMIHQQKLLLKN